MDSDADRGSRALGEPGLPDRRGTTDSFASGPVGSSDPDVVANGSNPRFDGSSDRSRGWSDASEAVPPPSNSGPRSRRFRRNRNVGPALESTTAAYADGDLSPAAKRWREIEAKRVRKARRSFWIELPVLLVVAFVMTFVIQTFFFKVYYIPSPSMEKTLHGVSQGGDRVLVNKIVYAFSEPVPGEVVVFSGPPTWAAEANIPGPATWYGKFFQALGSVVGIAPPNEKDFVKRVIATGGQTVECCDSVGNVTVNDLPLNEPYIFENFPFRPGIEDCTTPQQSERCFGPVTIPAGELWMMGDHRLVSKDSAFGCRHGLPVEHCQGPVPVDNVIGHAIAIVMPVSRWSGIGSPDIQGSAVGLVLAPLLLRRRPRHRYRWSSRWQHR